MRYIPNSPDERAEMLASIGLSSADELFRSIPADVQLGRKLNITVPLAEPEVIAALEEMAAKNTGATIILSSARSFSLLTRLTSLKFHRALCSTSSNSRR